MSIVIPKFYAGVADLQMTPFISFNTFRESLLWHLLFCGDLVVVDGFWLMSDYMVKDIKLGREKSLLLEGLNTGLVQPCFRTHVGGSFTQIFKEMQSQGIVGFNENSETIAETIDRSVSESEQYQYLHWPEELVGKTFLDEVTSRLSSDEPPVKSKAAFRIWKETKEWRTYCIEIALNRSDDGTLRRGELLDVVARTVGWEEKKKVPNAETVLKVANHSRKKVINFPRPYGRGISSFQTLFALHLFPLDFRCMLG